MSANHLGAGPEELSYQVAFPVPEGGSVTELSVARFGRLSPTTSKGASGTGNATWPTTRRTTACIGSFGRPYGGASVPAPRSSDYGGRWLSLVSNK
jgi:hypothetical protein